MIIATIEDDRYTYYITEEMRKYRRPEPRITKNFIKTINYGRLTEI